MNTTHMVEDQTPKFHILGIFPRCPFYSSVTAVSIILGLIALGTIGIYFLNVWAAGAYLTYSMLWYFLAMPFAMCKDCYYNIKESAIDMATGKTIEKLMPIEKWRETNGIAKHLSRGKRTTWLMSIIWILPFVLIFISFFKNFSIIALFSLIGFAIVLAGNYYYMLRKKCPSCAIQKECHAAFSNLRPG
jgi:membrane protein YdbS with pleckstrin-like domain